MGNYTIRTKDGEAKAMISPAVASNLFNIVNGLFRTEKYTDGRSCTVYEIIEECAFGYNVPGVGDCKIILWAGDMVCPAFH